MNWFEKFIYALQFEVKKPPLFGWYHICTIAITAILVTLIFVFRKKISKKFINILLIVFGSTLIFLEIFKQCIHSMSVVNGIAVWSYDWHSFPFQFCSVPILLMFIAGIIRKGKVYNAILCFLGTFSLFAGIVVVLYPSTVLSEHIFLSIHTMLWHCSMVLIGFMILATKSIDLNIKSVLKALIVFAIIISLAQIMNIIWHFCGNEQTFNMFYISPYYECELPLLSDIKEKTPYIVFLLCYLLGFIAIAFLIMGIAIGIDKLHNKIISKKQTK